jgi:hypothetical protein
VFVALEEEDIHDAIQRMRYRGVRRLPVVDREEALVGVIALDDLLEYIADELAGVARVSSRGRHAERKRRALIPSRSTELSIGWLGAIGSCRAMREQIVARSSRASRISPQTGTSEPYPYSISGSRRGKSSRKIAENGSAALAATSKKGDVCSASTTRLRTVYDAIAP